MILSLVLSLFVTHADDSLLKKVDEFRSPPGGFVAEVTVKESNGDESRFQVFIEGNDKSLIVTKAPARDVGRNMLMLDRDMWMFMPSINRSVRIALRQKLTGQVSQGDISRMKWFGDYTIEKIDEKGAPLDGVETKILELKASKENLTYDRIRLTITAKDSRPLQAEFLTAQGKPLKIARYENYGPLAGGTRPRLIRITNALKPSDVSEIHINDMTKKAFPQGFFAQGNLQKPSMP